MKLTDARPSVLLRGDSTRLPDEWQMAPVLWDAVCFQVDERQRPGQFILTGSATPDDEVMHPGTGRISRMVMRPMSLYKSGESNGSVSLSELFNGRKDIDGLSSMDVDGIARVIGRGSWPAAVRMSRTSEKNAAKIAIDYAEPVIHADISADGTSRSPHRVRRFLQSFARNISALASLQTIQTGIIQGDPKGDLSSKTISGLY